MNIKKNIALSETGFVFNPSNGDSFSVNPIGLEILKLLKDKKSLDEVKSHLHKTYNADEDSIEKDLYDFTKMIETFHLNEESKKM
jgi:hypothetical protein